MASLKSAFTAWGVSRLGMALAGGTASFFGGFTAGITSWTAFTGLALGGFSGPVFPGASFWDVVVTGGSVPFRTYSSMTWARGPTFSIEIPSLAIVIARSIATDLAIRIPS